MGGLDTDTLAELRDPERRPPAPQVPLSAAVLSHQPDAVCPLPESVLLGCLRGARRGSAAGPSGATSEHLRLLLDDPADGALLHRAAERLANADVPEQVLAAVRLGRMVALRKPNGRVRALVVGDVFRRLVARALAQHFAAAFQEACLPYQFGLSTRAGTEGLYKLLHTATVLDARATVLSVDAVGAYDHVSRQAMLEGLRSRPALAPLLPFARQFYGSASVYTWLDETGTEHDVLQGDGGEQGDPLMPALFSLAQHAALSEAAAGLQEGEAIFAFLDDTYVVSAPERTVALHGALEDALWRHARIRLNQGKTRVWNAAGEEPADLACLQPTGAEPVWTGAWSLPADQQGLLVLGAPLGSEAFVQQELHRKRETQDQLLTRLPAVGDLQSAWLLLLFCASPRANYLLRMLPPGATEAFAREHDAAVCTCLGTLLSQDSLPPQPLPQPSQRLAQLPLRYGGLGLRSAADAAPAAYWASWADCLPTIRARAPLAAARLVRVLQSSTETVQPLAAARHAAACLREQGYDAPAWDSLLQARLGHDEREFGEFLRGWQHRAALAGDKRALDLHLSHTDAASRALLLSQAGPHAGRAFTVFPTSAELTVPSPLFRVLLLRRLRLPLPVTPRTCACRGRLDSLGDHRAACATSGVLASRALPLERAVARVCQEAGARVARNVRLADMNIDVPVSDDRRIEVVANGLSLWHGAQQAVDATIVSPVTRAGDAQPGADVHPGRAVDAAARRKRHQTYPELVRARRCRLVVVGVEVGGRFGAEAANWLRLLAGQRASDVQAAMRAAARAAWVARWSGLLAVAAQRAVAAALLELPLAGECNVAGEAPELHEVLADVRWQLPTIGSRQGPR